MSFETFHLTYITEHATRIGNSDWSTQILCKFQYIAQEISATCTHNEAVLKQKL